MAILLSSCMFTGYRVEYRLKPVTHYKYDSILTREYMLERIEYDKRFGKWSSHLIDPDLLLPEEKAVYDSLMLKK